MSADPFHEEVWAQVGKGQLSPAEVLVDLERVDIDCLLRPLFQNPSQLEPLASGIGVSAGDASGPLVLSPEVATELTEHAEPGFAYVYSVPDGDARDFAAIRNCCGFFTSDPARTSFLPVQAVTDGKPVTIAVAAEYGEEPGRTRALTFPRKDGMTIELDVPRRFLRIHDGHGGSTVVEEGEQIGLSGHTGRIFRGSASSLPSPVERAYELLLALYRAAVECHGVDAAWTRLAESECFRSHEEELRRLIADPAFVGFQQVKRFALEESSLQVFATAHTVEDVAKARLLSSHITFGPAGLSIDTHDESFGIGLLRDERMWTSPEELDLLQLVLLGAEVLGDERAAQVHERYRSFHGERLFRVLSVGTGTVAVARTLCIPYNKIFPEDFDPAAFAERHGLEPSKVVRAVSSKSGEQETYHGCRGMRLFCQRPDIAELWLRTLLEASVRVRRVGVPLHLRILLATTTLAAEVKAFLDLFDRVSASIPGTEEVVKGVSAMLETAGAYIGLEGIWSTGGERTHVNGGLFGSNDFTAAVLNFNRADSPRNIIPGYLSNGLLEASPFDRLEEALVGKAILSSLRRIRWLHHGDSPQCWGLGGELAGDWESVQWLATEAAPLGLDYITTTPDQMPAALLAAAQAQARARVALFRA